MKTKRPLVAVVGHGGEEAGIGFDALEETYTKALGECAGVTPFLAPRETPVEGIADWTSAIDGVLLTGDPSNIEPWRYGAAASTGRGPYDPHRDTLALALVVEARRRALPLLGICRGLEEINVAYGGTLRAALHEEGFLDHREIAGFDPRVRYRRAHEVHLVPGGFLHEIAGAETWTVNSLHAQGIRDLGAELVIEARAPDGLIEAARDTERGRWIVGVQWHPEWESAQDRLSRGIFEAFGKACLRFHARGRSFPKER